MPELELRETSSNESIVVPAEGFIFGREGGDADIQLADQSISRRQVRIAFKMGNWVFETLAVPQGQKAPKPRALAEGETFRIGRAEFEVVTMSGAEGAGDPNAPKTEVPLPKKSSTGTPKSKGAASGGGGGDEAVPKSFGALFVAVPKGIAYYLLNVPKLLFNPFGTVRKAIEEQPIEPMGRIELIGYALPALMVTALLGSIAGGIAVLIAGGGFAIMSFIPVVPAISAFIGAIVVGFVFHPVMEWLVRVVFKGTTDARSRTNYFLQLQTLSILLAVPQALGAILASIRIPFINLVGPLLITVASLVSLYVVFQWFVSFGVAKWVRIVLLVLGVLSVAGAGIGLVTGLISNIRSLGSHSSTVDVTDTKDAEEAIKKARELAEAAGKKGGDDPSDPHPLVVPEKGSEKTPEKAVEKTPEKTPEKAVEKTPEKTPEKAIEKTPDKTPEKAVEKTPEKTPEREVPPTRSSGYVDFARKRAAVEKQLADDPTFLENRELQDLYGRYVEAVYDIDKKWRKDTGKHPDRGPLYDHLRDAELYRKTGELVDKLAAKLGVR